jgi:site-specific DNA recombinase
MPKKPVAKIPEASAPLVIALYIRVSSKRQADEGDSLESQERLGRRFVEERIAMHGWQVAGIRVYIEKGKSEKNTKRPELERLQRDIADGLVHRVVTFKLDRITRSVQDFVTLWDFFKKHGVDVISIRESFDTSSPAGNAMLGILMIFAQLEREMNSERTKATIKTRTENGLWGGGFAFGYVKDPATDKLVPHPVDAKIVKEHFFDAFEQEGSVGRVLRRLDRLGIQRPIRRAVKKDASQPESDETLLHRATSAEPLSYKPFEKQQVSRILQNTIYIGTIRRGETETKKAHDPLISEEQFARVQGMLQANLVRRQNTRYTPGRVYLLNSLLRCSCGAHLTGKAGTGRSQTYGYYVCTRRNHQGTKTACDAPGFPAEALEAAVMSRVRQISLHAEMRQKIVDEALSKLGGDGQRIASEIASVQQRLSRLQAEINNLLQVLKTVGAAALGSISEELQRLEAEQKQLRAEHESLQSQRAPLSAEEERARKLIDGWQGLPELLDDATPDERRVVLQHAIQVIELRAVEGTDGKRGTYALSIFPEFGMPGKAISPNDDGPISGEAEDGAVLTSNPMVRQVDERAPRGVHNSNRGSSSGEPFGSTGYGERLSSRCCPGRTISPRKRRPRLSQSVLTG